MNDRSLEFYSSLLVGFIYRALGELQSALDYYGRALRLCKDLGNKTDEPILLNNIGNVYDALGEPQKALAYYNDALALWSARNERGAQADTLNNVGLVYLFLGQPQRALDYYQQSLQLKRELGNATKTANTLSNIAVVYAILGEEGRALEYLKEASDLQHGARDLSGEATTYYFTAYVHAAQGGMTKALEDYNQALTMQRAVGNRRGEGITLDSMGVTAGLRLPRLNISATFMHCRANWTELRRITTKRSRCARRWEIGAKRRTFSRAWPDLSESAATFLPHRNISRKPSRKSRRCGGRQILSCAPLISGFITMLTSST